MRDDDLVMVFAAIAEAMFDADIVATAPTTPDGASEMLSAHVEYTGSFTGSLIASVSLPLARQLTSKMMQKPAADCDLDDLRDSLGELANIAAGNLRGLLAADCQIGLPRAQLGPSAKLAASESRLARAAFLLFGQAVHVELRGLRRAVEESSRR